MSKQTLTGTLHVENFSSHSDAEALAVCRTYVDILARVYSIEINIDASSGGNDSLYANDIELDAADLDEFYPRACDETEPADVSEAQMFIDENEDSWRSRAAWFVYRDEKSRTFAIRVNRNEPVFEIERKINEMREKILKFIQ